MCKTFIDKRSRPKRARRRYRMMHIGGIIHSRGDDDVPIPDLGPHPPAGAGHHGERLYLRGGPPALCHRNESCRRRSGRHGRAASRLCRRGGDAARLPARDAYGGHPLLNLTPQGLCVEAGGLRVVGFWDDPAQEGGRGFFYTSATGTFRTLQMPRGQAAVLRPTRIEASACGGGKIVGTYHSAVDNEPHGFLYDSATRTWASLDAPNARRTILRAVDAAGRLLGKTVGLDNVTRLFRRNVDGTFTFLTIPGFADVDVQLVGLTTLDHLAFNRGTTSFLYDGTTVHAILPAPGTLLTQLFGLREDGTLYGRAIGADGVGYAFLATPDAPVPTPRRPRQPGRPR